jgi:hypothetical protein
MKGDEDITETLKKELGNCPTFSGTLAEYLEASINSEPEGNGCRGWEYLTANITPELRKLLNTPEYWRCFYNTKTEEFILSQIPGELSEMQRKQLGAFVYCWSTKARECAKLETENGIIARGYTKITGTEKEYDGKKVKGFFNVSKIGILGSFNSLEQTEGRLKFVQGQLALIPKGCRTQGFYLREGAFIANEYVSPSPSLETKTEATL